MKHTHALLFIVGLLQGCGEAVIYHLNDTEHERLPKLFGLDEYAPCLSHSGTYCVARLHVLAEPGSELEHLINEYSGHTKKHFNYSYIDRGICLSECEMGDVTDASVSSVLEQCVNARERVPWRARVAHVSFCDTRAALSARPRTAADWLVAALALFVVAFNLIATVYDAAMTRNIENENNYSKVKNYILSFSLSKNWAHLISPENENRYKSLHGIRVICTLMVVYVHVSLLVQATFLSNPHDFELTFDNIWNHILLNGVTTVQAFFLLSGFLMMINLEKKTEMNQIKWKDVLKILMLRWWRLAPACVTMISFAATWVDTLESGPLWRLFVTDNIVKDCRKYWWQHVLFINNLDGDNKFCALQNWHVAVEFQLFCIGLIVYVVTASCPKLRSWILRGLLVVGFVSPALHVWLYDLEAQLMLTPEVHRSLLATSNEFHYAHVYVQNNLFCYFMGMIMGRWIHMHNHNTQNNTTKWKSLDFLVKSCGWLCIAAILGLFMVGKLILFSDSPRLPLQYRMLYASAHRPIFGFFFAVILLLLMTRKGSFTALMEWQFWVFPSRLSYSVYLVHLPIIHVYAGMRQNLTQLNLFDMLLIQLGVVIVSYVLALMLYLMVETPMNRLFKKALTAKVHDR